LHHPATYRTPGGVSTRSAVRCHTGGNHGKRSPRNSQKAGVDLNKLPESLVKNAAAELTTFYYYTILRVNLISLEGEGLKDVTVDARIEDRNHFEALAPRICELGDPCRAT
jgi:ferritin-like protein